MSNSYWERGQIKKQNNIWNPDFVSLIFLFGSVWNRELKEEIAIGTLKHTHICTPTNTTRNTQTQILTTTTSKETETAY